MVAEQYHAARARTNHKPRKPGKVVWQRALPKRLGPQADATSQVLLRAQRRERRLREAERRWQDTGPQPYAADRALAA